MIKREGEREKERGVKEGEKDMCASFLFIGETVEGKKERKDRKE